MMLFRGGIGERHWVAVACVSLAIASTATAQSRLERQLVAEADAFVSGMPAEIQPFMHTLYMEGEWNAVLNFNLSALAALEVGSVEIAEKALDQAIVRIEKIYANDPAAEKARSLWSAEEVKDFKGEPYERAMTYFYRGLLYLEAGDLGNARAAFLQSDLQNSMGQFETYGSSFLLATYLAAWASACEGDNAAANDLLGVLSRKPAADPFFALAQYKVAKHLIILERGIGPEKVTFGETKSILGFLPQPDTAGKFEPVPSPIESDRSVRGTAASLDWLALTRGERRIQGILDGKAVFKERTAGVSKAGAAIGEMAFYSSLSSLGSSKAEVTQSLGMLGLGASLIGGVSGAISQAANAEADTRYWGSLPKYIDIELSSSTMVPKIESFVSSVSGTNRLPLLKNELLGDSCSFTYAREFSALAPTGGGTGNPSPWPAAPREKDRITANRAFRDMLKNLF